MIFDRSFHELGSWVSIKWFGGRQEFDFLTSDIILHLSLAGNSDRLTSVRLEQPQEKRYPLLTVRAVFSCLQTKVWLPTLRIFNVRTDFNACDCIRGLCRHRKRVCSESWLWEKDLCRTGESNRPQRRTSPTHYRLSYIPAPNFNFCWKTLSLAVLVCLGVFLSPDS